MTAAVRGQEVRQRLLAAAAELIPERGWTAVSTRVLAERAGVTPSVVHYHFPSLGALLNEAAVGAMRQVLDGVDGILGLARTPADAVEVLLGSTDQYSGNDPTSLLFVEAYLAATRDEGLRAEIVGVVDGFRRRLGSWFGERGVPLAEETASVVAACVDGVLLHRGLGVGADPAAVVAVVRRLVGREEG
ncbi:TetR/AcrR family transcriptional regulator [Actinophytocola xinjiangensis]|uniref:TetR/AcrR family transcriptional regulator n=1 Tax=Actinophytocola xinjiangensis TaxID=485602 RepID=UPI000A79BE47